MHCPRCKNELPAYIFDPACDFQRCECGRRIRIHEMRQLIEPTDCLLVREHDLLPEEFSTDLCIDCHVDCILSNPDNDFDLVEDEEENWVYPEDLDTPNDANF